MWVTAIAPIAWGSTYFVTRQFLPLDYPLYGAAIRSLPAGLLLLAVGRVIPRGSWWWKSLILGVLNMSAFFALVYVAAQLLPTSIASVIMATSSVVMMGLAWAILAERPGTLSLLGAGVGLAGVCTMLLTGSATLQPIGVAASFAAMVMSSLGYILAKRWGGGVPVLASTSWQLVAGGLVLVPIAAVVEGPPPRVDAPAVAAYGFVSVVATAVAFVAWFAGLRHLKAGSVGLIGLLNPVTGVLLGTVLAAEALTARQVLGLVLVLTGVMMGQPRWRGGLGAGASENPTRTARAAMGRSGRRSGPGST